jgi:cytochrome P450
VTGVTQTESRDFSIEEKAPHLDLFDAEDSRVSLEVLSYAREHCTLLKTDADAGYYIAARYEDVHSMALDPQAFSSIEAGLRGIPIPMPPLTVDPPVHTEYRKQLNPFLSRSFLQRYEEDIRAIACELLDQVVPAGRMEFMSDFAVPLTAQALAKVILDDDDEELLERAAVATRGIARENSPEAFFEMGRVAEELLRARATAGTDRDDVLSAIVRATVEGRALTMEEMVGFTSVLMSGGLDTTKGAMGNILLRTLADPAIEDRLRDPDWIKTDLDEFLRLDSPIQFMARTVMKETELGGCPLKPGDRVAIHFASANRDPRQFEKADELDFSREKNAHVAFGVGPHRCIGTHFARLEMEVGFRELLARATNFRLPAGEEPRMTTGVVLAPEYLPIEFDVL